ncbi:hypothetical protein UCREL1_10194 [Eutypa lata UCREL1]|uniref:Uncharacterized protein n=1 Tax=Eutypa lata (strain UCR-EL1) TaxID=1287681 RepID=M7S9N8_EUTLA|nr:hypothetical protein UCREL1_10194 [Eutypa lata UCREL1]
MSKLAKTYVEPKGRYGNEHSIRDLEDWDQVYQLLENCREKYLGNKGWSKNVKKGWRHFTDNIGPLQQAWNLVPDIDYITPIRGTVEFLMDAIRRASEARKRILQGLEKLDSMFRDIELFLVVFPSDPNVYDAGTELVVSALRAVEKLIGFYLKCKGKKALSAMFKGDEYEADVISSLDDIMAKSESLRYEATKADMSQSAKNWRIAEHRHKELVELERSLKNGQVEIMQNLNAHAADIELGMTSIYHLIEEFEKNQAKE